LRATPAGWEEAITLLVYRQKAEAISGRGTGADFDVLMCNAPFVVGITSRPSIDSSRQPEDKGFGPVDAEFGPASAPRTLADDRKSVTQLPYPSN